MKTLGQLSPMVTPLAVAVSLVLSSGGMYAAGPAGGGGVASGATGTNGASVGATSAGISGASMGGAGRGGISSGSGFTGAHSGVSFSNNAGSRGTAFRGGGAPSHLSAPYHNVPNAGMAPAAAQRSGFAPSASRPANAWSGLAVNSANRPVATRSPVRSNSWTANGFAGQRLDPGAPGANLPTYNRGDYGHRGGNYRSRFGGRYYYNPYAYGPYYAPYINYLGGYYGGAYPYYNDIPTADTQFDNGANTVSPQYVEQQPADANNNDQPDPSAQQTPAPSRQQSPDANAGTIPNNGPDSLVEAVQEELVRRGYFGGKVDAMFNPEMKEALRKFQTDHHLAATGLINEATLHALQLD